jgi:NB-ARC domain
MKNIAVEQVLSRAKKAKSESDFTYFFSLLLAAEALAKTVVLGIVATIADDKDRNRYRLEHQLVRSDGLGDWTRVLEDALSGNASHFLLANAREAQADLTRLAKIGDWQFVVVSELKAALDVLEIEGEVIQTKTDMKRWFRLFVTLRNKTRAHGATQPSSAGLAAVHLEKSIRIFYENFSLFIQPWAYLHRNLSGKYRVSQISGEMSPFEYLKKSNDRAAALADGIYSFVGAPRRIPLMRSDPELVDFYFANGGFNGKTFEFLSYVTANKTDGDANQYHSPPGTLPASETEGYGELIPRGKCFSNAPEVIKDYVTRNNLEDELQTLLLDDKRPIVTLVGRGGIGKTCLALKVIEQMYEHNRYEAIVWLSARDVDLQLSGPKPVKPLVLSPDDMGKFYASLVLPPDSASQKKIDARAFFEDQLQKCDAGACLFVFDNFETTQNPIEMFTWIDSFIRLPNKALITTRLRDFKGDYPVDVKGMNEAQARQLISQTAATLRVEQYLDETYINELVSHSEGHPYVLKILLGEVAKARQAKNIPHLVAGSEDILTALFERTYAALSPCAQRAFLTLSAWNSSVPKLALEAVLYKSTQERSEVEKGVESLIDFSMAEIQIAPTDKQEFISLPLVASVFGKKKLSISPFKAVVQADAEFLQMFGPSRRGDMNLGLAKRLEKFIGNIAKRVEAGEPYASFSSVLEMICRAYNPGWLLLARWHMETRSDDGYIQAKKELERFLENDSQSTEAAEAWKMMGQACSRTQDRSGEIHAFIERSQITSVSFPDVSTTANKLNELLSTQDLAVDKDQKRHLVSQILTVLERRQSEADANDFSRMAWLAIHLDQEAKAIEFANRGLQLDSENSHCSKIIQRLGVSAEHKYGQTPLF